MFDKTGNVIRSGIALGTFQDESISSEEISIPDKEHLNDSVIAATSQRDDILITFNPESNFTAILVPPFLV